MIQCIFFNPYETDERTAKVEAAKKLLLAAGAGEVGNATAAFQVKAVGAAATVLDLSHLDMTELPVALKECSELEELKLRGNCLQHVPSWVWVLPKLRKIDLAQNDLKELPHAVGSAKLLEELDLRDNPGLADLCMELLQLEKLTTLRLGDEVERGRRHCSPMKNPPQEVCSKGLEAIKSFLRDSLQGTTPNMQVKVLLLGLGEAGKTSFANAIVEGRARPMGKEARTEGIEQRSMEVSTAMGKAQLLIYDFAGQKDYYITHHLFLTGRALYMLVFDLHKYERTDESFQRLVMDWVRSIQARCPGIKLMLVGTHADMIEGEGEIEARCDHVIKSLQAEEDKDVKQLRYCIEQLHDPDGMHLVGREAELLQLNTLMLNRLAMPQKVNAVSCWDGLAGIAETVADMTEAIQQKQYFGQLGELVPQSYQQLLERVKAERAMHPTMQWAKYAAVGKAVGIKESIVSVEGGEHKGRKGVLCTAVPLVDNEKEYQVRLEKQQEVKEEAKEDEAKEEEAKEEEAKDKEAKEEEGKDREAKIKALASKVEYDEEAVTVKGADMKGAFCRGLQLLSCPIPFHHALTPNAFSFLLPSPPCLFSRRQLGARDAVRA
jgi:GTPase SAR1 family protein